MSLYEVLGTSPQASAVELRQRYRELAFELHPDRGGDIARFRRVSEAYQVLKDPKRRARYDLASRFGPIAAAAGLPDLEAFVRELEELRRVGTVAYKDVEAKVQKTLDSLREMGVIGRARNRNRPWRMARVA